MERKIRRALISVSDKTGVVELARALVGHGCELISTGGTRRVLAEAGVPVTDIAAVTGNPEAFGGRMKTISFEIESAILFDRERDAGEAAALGIAPIDLIVCNLYPFRSARDAGAPLADLVEQIDVGGPTMIRAAAKNYRDVAVVCRPADYADLLAELAARGGATRLETRERLMREAFHHTADYDAMIAQTLDERFGATSLRLSFRGARRLRYGENAHQAAVLLRDAEASASLCDLEVLGGKELSYNNIVDLHAALDAVRDLEPTGCAVIKHTNPCGLAQAADGRRALELAWRADPVSAFGSVVAFNRPVDRWTAEFLELGAEDRSRRKFVEAIAAPSFAPDAVEALRAHDNLRIVALDPVALPRGRDVKVLAGAALVQTSDVDLWERIDVATARRPADVGVEEATFLRLLRFGTIAARQVKSNAIVLVGEQQGALRLLGMGAGQPNRVVSTRLAVGRARATLASEGMDEAGVRRALGGAVLVSDAFFPFPDSVEVAAAAGVRVFVHPGGSIRDKDVLARADALGVALVVTGTRHFRH